MEKLAKFEGEAAAYNRESVTEAAIRQAELLLDEQVPNLEKLSPAEQVESIKSLMKELSATKEGTGIPLNNKNRHVVEALAAQLHLLELFTKFQEAARVHPQVSRPDQV